VRRRDLVRVVLWMTGALLSFSAMAVSIRALSGTLRIMEILAIRNGAGLAILLALGAFNPAHLRALSARRIMLHITRNTIHFGSQFLWATGLTLLPLATVFALEFTMPAHTALLAAMFLGERLTPSRIGVVIFGFLGVLVILRPGLETFRPAAFLVLGAAFGYAVSLTQTKALTSTETTFAILFWMNVVQLPLAMLQRSALLSRRQRGRPAADRRGRAVGPCLAFLCNPGIPQRRRKPRGTAGFHAHPADCAGRLVALWRTARRLRLCRSGPDRARRVVEPARRGGAKTGNEKMRRQPGAGICAPDTASPRHKMGFPLDRMGLRNDKRFQWSQTDSVCHRPRKRVTQ
jgi:hypothetical protein